MGKVIALAAFGSKSNQYVINYAALFISAIVAHPVYGEIILKCEYGALAEVCLCEHFLVIMMII